ncbi:MAG: cysteine desulfurase [Candidatus Parcubacteria bacterium]|jgi:cysteine desulfurase|nr:cysteine desulfurase [Candidatus Parcubacteria bacterium]
MALAQATASAHCMQMSLFGSSRTYLDWASGAPVSRDARKAFDDALKEFGNPSSPHEEGARAKHALEDARTIIARLAEAKPARVIFTSGATEANNLALAGSVMRMKENSQDGIHVLYLPSAHTSVRESLKSLARWEVEIEPLKITDGKIDLTRLKEQLRSETRLVVIDAVCGETGTRWNTRGVRNVLNAHAEGSGAQRILLHVDASQTPPGLPWSLTRFSADMLTLDAQKVGGIRGIGALCTRSHVRLSPLMHGGGQEGRLRPGTEPVALAAAFAAALTEAERTREPFLAHAQRARTRLIGTLTDAIPGMTVNEGREGVPHILNLSFPGRDTDYAVMLLDREGFAVSTKSACESGSEQGSRAVLALTNDEASARSTLRISWGISTSSRDLDRFAHALMRTIRFLDGTSV